MKSSDDAGWVPLRREPSTPMVYVRLIDGSTCLAPVPARQESDHTYLLLPNSDFDPNDSSTLFEFLPGDRIRVESGVAVELLSSSFEDRDYGPFCSAWRGRVRLHATLALTDSLASRSESPVRSAREPPIIIRASFSGPRRRADGVSAFALVHDVTSP